MIVSSVLRHKDIQPDGRYSVFEEHTTHDGRILYVNYMAEKNADVQQVMEDRVSGLEAQLAVEDLVKKESEDYEEFTKKRDTYLEGLGDSTLKQTLALTDDELEAKNKYRG